MYSYCSNNPLMYYDPSGHAGQVCLDKYDLYRIYRKKGLSVEKARDAADAYKKKYGDYDLKHEFDVEKENTSKPIRNSNDKHKKQSNDVKEGGKKTGRLPDWLKEKFEEGNNFNKENRPRYPYNEVEVYGKKRYVVDSYVPGEEIVSRKYTQLADVKESTAIGYLNELKTKYPSGAIITDSPFNPKILRGQPMRGQQILEIPVQNKPIPQNVIDYANSNNIIIRDVERNVYN